MDRTNYVFYKDVVTGKDGRGWKRNDTTAQRSNDPISRIVSGHNFHQCRYLHYKQAAFIYLRAVFVFSAGRVKMLGAPCYIRSSTCCIQCP